MANTGETVWTLESKAEGFIRSVRFVGAYTETHDADETRYVTRAEGQRWLREMRKLAREFPGECILRRDDY